jgi:hypothetical protein
LGLWILADTEKLGCGDTGYMLIEIQMAVGAVLMQKVPGCGDSVYLLIQIQMAVGYVDTDN